MTVATSLRTINANDLYNKMKSGDNPVVINALAQDAYLAKHIPGSINIPTEKADLANEVVPYKDAEIIVYCANADCTASPDLSHKLEEMGYTNVTDFDEGLAGWRKAGYELTGNEV